MKNGLIVLALVCLGMLGSWWQNAKVEQTIGWNYDGDHASFYLCIEEKGGCHPVQPLEYLGLSGRRMFETKIRLRPGTYHIAIAACTYGRCSDPIPLVEPVVISYSRLFGASK